MKAFLAAIGCATLAAVSFTSSNFAGVNDSEIGNVYGGACERLLSVTCGHGERPCVIVSCYRTAAGTTCNHSGGLAPSRTCSSDGSESCNYVTWPKSCLGQIDPIEA